MQVLELGLNICCSWFQ